MERLLRIAIIKMCGKALLLTMVAGLVIAVIGRLSNWDTSLEYSNAFFAAGCFVIIAGASSRMGAGSEWTSFQLLSAESFRNMSNSERANFILNASTPVSLVILGLLSGTLLIIISWLVAKLF